jgi:hypothetical protein
MTNFTEAILTLAIVGAVSFVALLMALTRPEFVDGVVRIIEAWR